MSTGRQFEQSAGRQFVQSPARQRNLGLEGPAAGALYAMQIAGFAIAAGYADFLSTDANTAGLYGKISVKVTLTWYDGASATYVTHSRTETAGINDFIGDQDTFTRQYDEKVYTTWNLPSTYLGTDPLDVPPDASSGLVESTPPAWANDMDSQISAISQMSPSSYVVDESATDIEHAVIKIHMLGDPDVIMIVEAILSVGPRTRPTRQSAENIMDELDFTCDQEMQVLNDGGTTNTGLGSPNFRTGALVRTYSRTTSGIRKVNVAPSNAIPTGQSVSAWFPLSASGRYAGSEYGFFGVRYMVTGPTIPLFDNPNNGIDQYRATGFYWNAAKLKVARGRQCLELIRNTLTPDPPRTLGPDRVSFINMTGDVTCEPCRTLPLAQRCRYGIVLRPVDADIPGVVTVTNPPATVLSGVLWYDLNGNGVKEDTIAPNPDLVLDLRQAIPTRIAVPYVPVEISAFGPDGINIIVFTNHEGEWSYTFPLGYLGTATARVMTERPEFLTAFTSLIREQATGFVGYLPGTGAPDGWVRATGAIQTGGVNPTTQAVSPNLPATPVNDFGIDGFQPVFPP